MSKLQRVGAAVVRWLLTGASVLLFLAFCISVRWTVFRMAQFGDTVCLRGGQLSYLWSAPALRQRLSAKNGFTLELCWEWHADRRAAPMEWGCYRTLNPMGRSLVSVPLWLPWAAVTVPCILLWWRHRRRPALPGHCPACGYDLRGLPGAETCPECGWARGQMLLENSRAG
jgi:hypothetical protein